MCVQDVPGADPSLVRSSMGLAGLARFRMPVWCLLATVLTGCAGQPEWLASSGPSTGEVEASGADPAVSGIQLVDVTDAVARRLLAGQRQSLFSETLGSRGRSGGGDWPRGCG